MANFSNNENFPIYSKHMITTVFRTMTASMTPCKTLLFVAWCISNELCYLSNYRFQGSPLLIPCPDGEICPDRAPQLCLLPPQGTTLLCLCQLCRCQATGTLQHNKEVSKLSVTHMMCTGVAHHVDLVLPETYNAASSPGPFQHATLAPFTLANLERYGFSMGLSRAWFHP